MNTKRQTIWLVSMLSLMVLLSAYYLFTQDISQENELTDAAYLNNSAEVSTIIDDQLTMEGQALNNEDYTISEVDQHVLSLLQAEGYFNSSEFGELFNKREDQLQSEENRIMSVLADVTNEADASLEALQEMALLEEKMEKLSQLEYNLMENYEVAIVSEEVNDKYQVVVASDNLEKKEALAIIEQVMAELEVRPEQVSVKFVPTP